MNDDQKNELAEIRNKAQGFYHQDLKRALSIMHATFMSTILIHTKQLGYKDRGILKPTRVDLTTAEKYADASKANIVARSPLTEFLSALLLRTSFDTILTEEYFEEFVLPNITSTEEVQDFLLDLHARFYTYWMPNEPEILQVATAVVQGFKQVETPKDVVWVLPESIIKRMPIYEYWLDKLRTNRFLMMVALLHLCNIDPNFIEDLQ